MSDLLPGDQAFLDECGMPYRVELEGGFVCVILEQFALAAGLSPAASDLLVRIPPGYPDANPDMFWFADPVTRADRRAIPALGSTLKHRGQVWYRWSRHVGRQWRPGVDDLRSYIAYVRTCVMEAAR